MAIASRFDGVIIACDSTAVYRGIDIGTDKVPTAEQRGIPHYLVDVADPRETYSAARYARDAAEIMHSSARRDACRCWPEVPGFTTVPSCAASFPGRRATRSSVRGWSALRISRGVEFLHRWLVRVDPDSGLRIQPRDLKRIVRALEV